MHICASCYFVATSFPTTRVAMTTGYGYCLFWQFQCRSGQCIPAGDRCDGVYDCYDHTDEYNCRKNNYCKTLIFSEPFNLAKLAIEIKTLKIKAAKIKP